MIITHYNREMQRIRFFFFFVQRSVSFVSFIRLARHSKRTEQFVNIRSRLYIQEGEVSRVFLGQDRISFEATVSRKLFGMSFILLEWIFSLYRTIIYKLKLKRFYYTYTIAKEKDGKSKRKIISEFNRSIFSVFLDPFATFLLQNRKDSSKRF